MKKERKKILANFAHDDFAKMDRFFTSFFRCSISCKFIPSSLNKNVTTFKKFVSFKSNFFLSNIESMKNMTEIGRLDTKPNK